jgi:hypothetical protein
MKVRYYLSAAALATALLFSPTADAAAEAKACCVKTTTLVQDGKACDKCAEHTCCKATAKIEIKKMTDAGKKMGTCAGCEAKKKEKKPS